MPDFIVNVAFKSKDQLSSVLKELGINADNFSMKTERAFRRSSKSAISFKRILGGVLGADTLRAGFNRIQQGAATVVDEFIDFDDAITAASGKFGEFDRSSQAFKDLKQTARDVGASTEFTSTQAGKGLLFLAKAGWNVKDAMAALPSFVDLATASEMEFSRAADIATDVLGQFGLNSDDSATKIKNLGRVNDVLSKAVNMANIDMEDFFETAKMAGPVFTTANMSIEKFGAMTAFVGNAGIKASLGGTALRTMMTRLMAPTDKVKRKFKRFGIALTDGKKNMRDPIKILGQLNAKFEKLGTSKKGELLNLIFGRRAISGAAVSIRGATGAMQKFEEQLNDAEGSSQRLAQFMRTSLGKRLDVLKSKAIDMGFRILDVFEKRIPGGIDSLIEKIENFDVTPIVDGIETVIGSIKWMRDFIKEWLPTLREFKGVIALIGLEFVAWKLGESAKGLGTIYETIMNIKSAGGLVAAIAAGGLFATVMLAVTAVIALGVGIYVAANNWDDLNQATKLFVQDITNWAKDTVLDYVQERIDGIRESIVDILTLIGATGSIEALQKRWGGGKPPPGSEEYKARPLVDEAKGFGNVPYEERGAKAMTDAEKAARQLKKLTLPSGTARTKGDIPTAEGIGLPFERERNLGRGLDFNAPVLTDKGLSKKAKRNAELSRVGFEGTLNIKGAPAGSTYSGKTTGAPAIDVRGLGANP